MVWRPAPRTSAGSRSAAEAVGDPRAEAGLARDLLPVCMNVMAGSWLIASVCMMRMKHMSSTIFAVCGSSSLTHIPLLPCCANLYFDGAIGKRALARGHGGEALALADRVGQILVVQLLHLRLVVVQIHLRRAADHVQVDDVLGLGGKCVRPRRRRPSADGEPSPAHCRCRQQRGQRQRQPRPLSARPKNCRRVSIVDASDSSRFDRQTGVRAIVSFVQHLVQVHQLVGQHRPGGQRPRRRGVGSGFDSPTAISFFASSGCAS